MDITNLEEDLELLPTLRKCCADCKKQNRRKNVIDVDFVDRRRKEPVDKGFYVAMCIYVGACAYVVSLCWPVIQQML